MSQSGNESAKCVSFSSNNYPFQRKPLIHQTQTQTLTFHLQKRNLHLTKKTFTSSHLVLLQGNSLTLLQSSKNLRNPYFKKRTVQIAYGPKDKMDGDCMTEPLQVLSDSNTNVNSMINRRVSLFYRYPLKAFHHMVCPCVGRIKYPLVLSPS